VLDELLTRNSALSRRRSLRGDASSSWSLRSTSTSAKSISRDSTNGAPAAGASDGGATPVFATRGARQRANREARLSRAASIRPEPAASVGDASVAPPKAAPAGVKAPRASAAAATMSRLDAVRSLSKAQLAGHVVNIIYMYKLEFYWRATPATFHRLPSCDRAPHWLYQV